MVLVSAGRIMLGWFKKLSAIFLITLFVSGSALPLVLCVSGSDHLAIEFKIGAGAHHPATPLADEFRNFSSLVADNLAEPSRPCLDRDLVPTSATITHHDQKLLPANSKAPEASSYPQSIKIVEMVRARSIGIPPPFEKISSQLAHLRTVILLI